MLEAILRQERDRAQKYLDIAGVIFVVLNHDQTVALINKKGCEILGYEKEEEILGKNWFDQFLPERVREEVKTIFDQLMAGEIDPVEYFENPVLTKQGRERIMSWHNTILTDETGKIIGTLSSGEDITERKQVEELLRGSEEKYRTLVEQNLLGIMIFQDERIVFANQALAKMSGFTVEELLNLSPEEVQAQFHPEDRPLVFSLMQDRLEGNPAPSQYQYRGLRKNREVFWIDFSANLIEYKGRPAVQGTFLDITERKRAEEHLRYQADLLLNVSDAVISSDMNFIIKSWNKAAEVIYGWAEEEVLDKRVNEVTQIEYPYDRERDVINELLEKGIWRGEVIQRRKDGTSLNILASVSLIKNSTGNPVGALAVNRDITERKQAEEELQEAKEKYQTLVEKMHEGVLLEDEKGFVSFVNPRLGEMLGYTEEELIGRHWSAMVPVEELDKVKKETAKRPRGISSNYESVLLSKDGEHIPVIISVTSLFTDTGSFQGTLSVFTNISDRKRVEKALITRERELENIFEHTGTATVISEENTVIFKCNRQFECLSGYTKEEMEGKMSWTQFVHPEDLSQVKKYHYNRRIDKAGVPKNYEFRFIDRQGNQKHIYLTGGMVPETKRDIASLLDITNRKQAEEALRQVKLAEERYHTMLGHFLKNNLHEILNNLEYFALTNQLDQNLNETIVDRINDISFRSSRTIDTVNKIFRVLQTPFSHYQENLNLLDIIEKVIFELQLKIAFSHPVTIKQESIDIEIKSNQYIRDVFSEILVFLLSPTNGEIIIEGDQSSSFFSVNIQDYHSRPIPEEVCIRLADTITDKWESQGHFIGISLASVIMQHYGGKLIINPSEHNGNTFQLLFPSHLIQTKK